MKFDFCIGNPPYQEDEKNASNNRKNPVYHYFYEVAGKIADHYLLISPARFLYNAGLTPKEWNKKMLNDEHIKVEHFEADSKKYFLKMTLKAVLQ